MSLQAELINKIIQIEGGYCNDPSDSGGETNHGITLQVARANGYAGKMCDMPEAIAFGIYADKYWNSLRLSEIVLISELLTLELFDTGVNQGVTRSARFLQRSLNVLNNRGEYYADITADGFVGSKTILALKQYVEKRGHDGLIILIQMLNCLQGAFYVDLAERREKDEKYVYGWFRNRVS